MKPNNKSPNDNATPILPCAHCGGENITSSYIRDGRSFGCNDCGVSVISFNPDARAKNLKKWNTRAETSANEWVKIEDIPTSWKDGRPVDLFFSGERNVNCSYRLCGHAEGLTEKKPAWVCSHNLWISEDITHAMLPPEHPK